VLPCHAFSDIRMLGGQAHLKHVACPDFSNPTLCCSSITSWRTTCNSLQIHCAGVVLGMTVSARLRYSSPNSFCTSRLIDERDARDRFALWNMHSLKNTAANGVDVYNYPDLSVNRVKLVTAGEPEAQDPDGIEEPVVGSMKSRMLSLLQYQSLDGLVPTCG